eukprot:16431548-Heterocapsa_arctica.AAC.1
MNKKKQTRYWSSKMTLSVPNKQKGYHRRTRRMGNSQEYPAIRVLIRAEQPFHEAQVDHTTHKEAVEQRKTRKLKYEGKNNLEQQRTHNIQTNTVDNRNNIEDAQLTCIPSVSHEVDRINEGKQRSNIGQVIDCERTIKSSKTEYVHTEQTEDDSQMDKDNKGQFIRILREKQNSKKGLKHKGKTIKTHVQQVTFIQKVAKEASQARARPLGLAGWLTGPVMAH